MKRPDQVREGSEGVFAFAARSRKNVIEPAIADVLDHERGGVGVAGVVAIHGKYA